MTRSLRYVTCHFKEAKKAYQSVMVVRPRRPISEEYLEFEKEVMQRSLDEFGYVWQAGHQGAEV